MNQAWYQYRGQVSGTRALCESDRARRNRSLSLFLFQRFVAPDAALQHRNVRRRGAFMVFLIDGF
jgi:hypothetical protein